MEALVVHPKAGVRNFKFHDKTSINLPSISYREVFSGGTTRKELTGRILDGYSLFKKGIRPEWEDEANAAGSEYKTTRPINNAFDADQHWENMVLALIGETLDENDEICGCRVTDKTKKEKKHFRLELWLRSKDASSGERIKSRLLEALTEGHAQRSPLEFDRKSH